MDLESIKKWLENGNEWRDRDLPSSSIDDLPLKGFDPFVIQGIAVDLLEPGRVICSLKIPPRLLNIAGFLHGGATASLIDEIGSAAILSAGVSTSGVSLEISASYLDSAFLDEEIEIEAKVLRVGKAVGVVNVELRKKKTGKIVAHGRHTKYLNVSSKM